MSNKLKYVLVETIDFPKLLTYKSIKKNEYKILKYFEYYNIRFIFNYNNVEYNIETYITLRDFELHETNNTLQKVFGTVYSNPIDICTYILHKYYFMVRVLKNLNV